MNSRIFKAVFMGMMAGLIFFAPLVCSGQAKGPIKIGFIAPLSGWAAAHGKDMLGGMQLYLEEIGYKAAGRKIELIIEDTEGNPATALTKTRKLVEKDGVHQMTGGADGLDGLCPCALHRLQRNPHDLPDHVGG
jgi:branched-chain amino acid transport system substrate-binding protein